MTILCEIADILNNRSLLPFLDDIDRYDVLTPNNVLIRCKSRNICYGQFSDNPIDYSKDWKSIQAISNMYWARWLRAYLQDGQTEKNGFDNQKIQAFNKTLRKCWLISQVLKFFSACDDIAQSVKVKAPPVELVSSSNFLCFMEAVFE